MNHFDGTAASASSPGRGLAGQYVCWAALATAAIAALWALGFEAIVYHPTPFYALFRPAEGPFWSYFAAGAAVWAAAIGLGRAVPGGRVPLSWAAGGLVCAAALSLALASVSPEGEESLPDAWTPVFYFTFPVLVFGAFFGLLFSVLPGLAWYRDEPSRKAAMRMLTATAVFLFLFAGAVAMMRGGLDGISQAYARQDHEYIGDIGSGLSIRGLFRDYATLHPHLSMHAKVHPPGPIALLWVMSFFSGRSPLGLSIATMLVGAASVVPLYLWAAAMFGRRIGLTAAMLYALIPTVVLFTATSADIVFMPLTLFALYFFWRAVHERSAWCAAAAGLFYGAMALTSYSLIGVGAFFGFVGLWRLASPAHRLGVIQTAAIMSAMVVAVHGAVYGWSGYDPFEIFRMSKAQFDLDQHHLDQLTPRFSSIWFKLVNPACWLIFAGIPVSVLFFKRLARSEGDGDSRALFIVMALTLLALNGLYLARGEGERSAMYVMPFLVIPAAHFLDGAGRRSGSFTPLAATLGLLALQTWLMELMFYTYW